MLAEILPLDVLTRIYGNIIFFHSAFHVCWNAGRGVCVIALNRANAHKSEVLGRIEVFFAMESRTYVDFFLYLCPRKIIKRSNDGRKKR